MANNRSKKLTLADLPLGITIDLADYPPIHVPDIRAFIDYSVVSAPVEGTPLRLALAILNTLNETLRQAGTHIGDNSTIVRMEPMWADLEFTRQRLETDDERVHRVVSSVISKHKATRKKRESLKAKYAAMVQVCTELGTTPTVTEDEFIANHLGK